MRINGRTIKSGQPCYLIAEMSANHGGSLDRALAIVRAAKDAGADAVKLQTYTPDTMTLDCDNEYFQIPKGSLWEGKTLYALYREAMTPWEWHRTLKDEAARLSLDFFSTPFDETAVDFLEDLRVPAYKIASFELTDDPLLKKVAAARKPVILSTGMATEQEIAHALAVLSDSGAGETVLLKCLSAYPAPVEKMNLRSLITLRERFGVDVGLSDHSVGSLAAVIGVSLGACVIEKHLCLDDGVETPDSAFSLSPVQFAQMVKDVRTVEAALGTGALGAAAAEKENLRFRRSIFAARDISLGERITPENVRVIRPGFGLSPVRFDAIMGQKARSPIKKGMPLSESMLESHG